MSNIDKVTALALFSVFLSIQAIVLNIIGCIREQKRKQKDLEEEQKWKLV
jgi:hypothetical protein